MATPFEISETLKYNDAPADNVGINNNAESGLLWRSGLDGIVKILSASEFSGRVLGITTQGEITWVDMSNPTTAFGEVSVASVQPVIQLSFLNGLAQEDNIETFTRNGGTVAFDEPAQVTVNLAAQANSVAVVHTRDELIYRPGQGSIIRATCVFGAPQTNSRQFVGFGNYAGGFYFGYQNTSFGIFRLYGGRRHIHKFTIDTAANASQTATITLNGTAINVALINANTAASPKKFTAYQIGAADYSAAGFFAEAGGNDVYFYADFSEVRGGTYSFSSTGNATATLSTIQSGVAYTEDFVAQSSWNGDDTHDGTGESGFLLDPLKGNVYQVQFQWLGYGAIFFSIENGTTGTIERVHTYRYPNTYLVPSLENPNGWIAMWARAHGGVPGGTIAMKTACFFGGTEGFTINDVGAVKYATSANRTNIAANVITPVLSLRNNIVVNDRITTNIARILFLSASSDSNKPVQIFLLRRATLGTGTTLNYPEWVNINTDQSIMAASTSSTTIGASYQILQTFVIGKTDSAILNVANLNVLIRPGEYLVLAATCSNGSNDISVSWTWVEDQS